MRVLAKVGFEVGPDGPGGDTLRKARTAYITGMLRASFIVAISAVVLMVSGCGPPAPALLEGLSASGGETMACPNADGSWTPRRGSRLNRTPELERRLSHLVGSDEAAVEAVLRANEFEAAEACPGSPQVRHATYRDQSRFAVVLWEMAADHKVKWISGYISYYGL